MLSNRHDDSYKLEYLTDLPMFRWYVYVPIDIMTATNWNNLQIYPCKKQAGSTFMLSNQHHDSYKLE